MIYLDSHATTRLAPEVLEAMLPLFQEQFANPGSITHELGREVQSLVEASQEMIATLLGAVAEEIVFTSGATEANNLALFGACLYSRQKRRKVLSFQTEHRAVLDPLLRLQQHGFEVEFLPVQSEASEQPGTVDLELLKQKLDSEVALVSVMLANNEIGTIQPLADIARLCRAQDVLLHCDAAQAVGRLPVNVDELDVDLLSFSAHKFHGPKGIGGLYVRQRDRRVRLQPQIVGGGQQNNRRSGTLNAPAVVGMAAALNLSTSLPSAAIHTLRDRLYEGLLKAIPTLQLNGPALNSPLRAGENLNCSFYPLEGQGLMLEASELAVSSGSACTSADPTPSHVLQAIGLTEDQARSSLRFGLDRYTTAEEIDQAIGLLVEAAAKLRKLI